MTRDDVPTQYRKLYDRREVGSKTPRQRGGSGSRFNDRHGDGSFRDVWALRGDRARASPGFTQAKTVVALRGEACLRR